jgi:hypothetical protein
MTPSISAIFGSTFGSLTSQSLSPFVVLQPLNILTQYTCWKTLDFFHVYIEFNHKGVLFLSRQWLSPLFARAIYITTKQHMRRQWHSTMG